MSGSNDKGKDVATDRPDSSDEEFDEVQCENSCKAGFKVLIGQTVVVLICLRCRLEYELSQDLKPGDSSVD